MSGTPKHCQIVIEAERRRRIEEERRRQNEIVRRRKQEAERKARAKRMARERSRLIQALNAIGARIEAEAAALFPNDADRLSRELRSLRDRGQTSEEFGALFSEAERLQSLIREAVQRFRKEEERLLDRLARASAAFSRLKRVLSDVEHDRLKFDAEGARRCEVALGDLQKLLDAGNPDALESALARLEELTSSHLARTSEAKESWLKAKQAAYDAIGEAEAILRGMRADQFMMRWHAPRIETAGSELEEARAACAREKFEVAHTHLTVLRIRSQEWRAQAEALQLEADKRDYIANSLRAALESMGYTAVVEEEHQGHPLTAVVVRSVAASGRGIQASVPVDGNVQYVVDGFELRTESGAHGEPSATCDQAESALLALGDVLEGAYGVEMGELSWEGKDPDRTGKKAEPLPKDSGQKERGR